MSLKPDQEDLTCYPTGKPEESANGWREDEQRFGQSDIDGCGDGE
jgi:hypothetical protein